MDLRELAGRLVAEDGVVAHVEPSGPEVGEAVVRVVPDRIDARVDGDQGAAPEPIGDRAAVDPCSEELAPRDPAALAAGELADHPVNPPSVRKGIPRMPKCQFVADCPIVPRKR